ncbi:MAG: hypothetical protein R2762_09045 [Bryobacteraceae bacterium]
MIRQFAISLTLLTLLGCGSDINNKEAIRQGVVDHLGARKGLDLDMSAMEVDVASVTFRGNEADADVSFRARGSQQSMMQMKYTLERDGSRWKVKAKKDSGAGHGAGAANPHGGAMPGAAPQGALPQGHPPMDPGEPKK